MKHRLLLIAIAGAALLPAAQAQTIEETPDPPSLRPVAPRPQNAASAASFKGPVDPVALKPFAEVVAGAKRQDGLLPLWRRDEKVWLETGKEMVGKPFLFTVNIANSVGERGLYASQMGTSQL